MAGVLLCRPVLKFNSMANYDPKITEAMVAWLRGEHSSDESILKGAELLLRVNRNKGLFERIRRYPKGGVKKLEYEIKKHVNYRLQGYTIQDIEALDAEVTPQVKVAIDAAGGAADFAAAAGAGAAVAVRYEAGAAAGDCLPGGLQRGGVRPAAW